MTISNSFFILLMKLSFILSFSQWEYIFYKKLLDDFNQTISSNMPKSLYSSLDYQTCNQEMYTSFASNTGDFYSIIANSGKELFDLGNEDECVENGLTYALIVYRKNPELAHDALSTSAAFKFLGKTNYFFGFCIKSECEPFVRKFFDKKENKMFFNKLNSSFAIEDINAITMSKVNEGKHIDEEIYKQLQYHTIFLTIFISLSVGIFIRVLVFLFGLVFQNKDNFRKVMQIAYKNTFVVSDNNNYISQANNNTTGISKSRKRRKSNTNLNDEKDNAIYETDNNLKSNLTDNNNNQCAAFNINDVDDSSSSSRSSFSISEKSNYSEQEELEGHASFHNKVRYKKKNIKCCSLSFLYSFLSIGSSIRVIFTSRNFIYNDNGLQLINFFRVYSLFWMTYNHNIWALIRVPGRNVNSYSFFKDLLFSLVKYSIYGLEIWISLEGFFFGFKLMSYMKRHYYNSNSSTQIKTSILSNQSRGNNNNNQKPSLVLFFFKFYINFIPKCVTCFFVFFMFHYFVRNYRVFYSDKHELGALFSYFERYIIYCRECITNPLVIIKPFAISYNDFLNQDIAFSQCFKFIYLFVNEHYSFIIALIIFFFSFKLQSKKFDITIVTFFIFNFLLSYFSTRNYTGRHYHFIFALGETASIKYTHLYLNSYMAGVFVGVSCFYYKDALSTHPIETNVRKYKPFSFCYSLIMLFDHLGKKTKTFMIIMCISIHIALSYSFNIMSEVMTTENNDKINFKINFWVHLYSVYEKKIFLIFFLIMILLIVTYPKDTLFKYCYSSTFFSAFSRVGFSYLCSLDSLVYLFYCFYHVDLHFNYQNLFYVTFGLVVLIGLFNIGIVILLELPIRMMFKMIKRKCESVDTSKEEMEEYDNEEIE